MKIMLLGKNGQLGQEIQLVGQSPNFSLTAFSHDELDITDEKKLQKKIKEINPDVLINTTAYHVVPDCDLYPAKAFSINCFAVTKLALFTAQRNISLVTYSTDYVFDGEKKKPYRENDLPNPLQMYGISKYAGEVGALNYNPRSYVIRTCGVYGGKQGSKSKKGNFILSILEKAKSQKEIEVADDQIVNPTYAHDLAQKTLELLRKKPQAGIYHLANSGFCSWADFAQKIIEYKKINHVTIKRVSLGGEYRGVKRPLYSALASVKIQDYSISMPSWEDALERYLQYLVL